jgi:hypothetical protein|tara:strand:+ start:331 stop:528 length:198 start_codon:yes stop_codon:yes gene_type:complete
VICSDAELDTFKSLESKSEAVGATARIVILLAVTVALIFRRTGAGIFNEDVDEVAEEEEAVLVLV